MPRKRGSTVPVQEPPAPLATNTAADIMVRMPTCLPPVAPLHSILHILQRSTHHGFPVAEAQLKNSAANGKQNGAASAPGQGRLVGLVLRSQLLVLLQTQCVPPRELGW